MTTLHHRDCSQAARAYLRCLQGTLLSATTRDQDDKTEDEPRWRGYKQSAHPQTSTTGLAEWVMASNRPIDSSELSGRPSRRHAQTTIRKQRRRNGGIGCCEGGHH